jgi:hypothetical protein
MGLFTERDEETTNEIIIGKLNRIEAKLDAVIKALHEYDDEGYGESSFETFMDTKQSPCVKHDAASWEQEVELNKRMDIIGQNGNEGSHYVTNEEADEDAFSDYGKRVSENKNKTQTKQKQYWKNNRSKRNNNKK